MNENRELVFTFVINEMKTEKQNLLLYFGVDEIK
jgi:hypothetical protein